MRVRYEVGPRVFEVEGELTEVDTFDRTLIPRWVLKMVEQMVVVVPDDLVEDDDPNRERNPF